MSAAPRARRPQRYFRFMTLDCETSSQDPHRFHWNLLALNGGPRCEHLALVKSATGMFRLSNLVAAGNVDLRSISNKGQVDMRNALSVVTLFNPRAIPCLITTSSNVFFIGFNCKCKLTKLRLILSVFGPLGGRLAPATLIPQVTQDDPWWTPCAG
jgi:hypothetical protein